jgi:hypothetical protein
VVQGLHAGCLYGVTQGADGTIVAIGEAHTNRRSEVSGTQTNQWPIYYNPGITTSDDLTTIDCSSAGMDLGPKAFRTPTVMKTDLDGVVQWQNFYGIDDELEDGWSLGGVGYDIEPAQVDGASGFYATFSGSNTTGATNEHPFVLQLNNDGSIHDRHVFFEGDPALVALGFNEVQEMRPLAVDVLTIGGQQRVAISGRLAEGTANAFLWYFDDIDQYVPTLAQATNSTQLSPAHHNSNLIQHSTGVVLAEVANEPVVIWPVLSDYTEGDFWGGSGNRATLKVHRFDPQGANPLSPVWTANLGRVGAYDLQADGGITADEHVAIVSSKWAKPFADGNPFRYTDLPSDVHDCLETNWGVVNWESTTPWEQGRWNYWNTDAYVSKITLGTGQTLWSTTFDSDPDVTHGCWPDDIRKQECMYKITEAADGGLVVSGNVSRNFDDGYLAKLGSNCQSKLAYANLPLTEGEHLLASDQVWTTDRNVVGKLVIPDGRTLTVDNAMIRFADSEQLEWATQLIVQKGGRLVLTNNATLSAVQGCPNSMWDGVQVRGNYFAGQSPTSNQGYARLSSGATIEHARAALLAAWGIPSDPLGAIIKESTGGIIQAGDAVFRNNRYDAVFHRYENRDGNGNVIANRSSFTRCEFLTQGDLNIPELYPKDHAALLAVRGVRFHGCTFSNALVGSTYEMPYELGTGIRSINSTFTVSNDCNIILPYGTPCPPANTTTSLFSRLHYGIVATAVDPSRTFSVSDATFARNNFGIRMEGVQDAALHRNGFDIPEPIIPGILGSVYGVYSDQCTGYSIQENDFVTNQPSGSNTKVGLIIKDSGPAYNTFYNNTFNNLHTGSLVQGKNATLNGSVGLEVKCNDYGMVNTNRFDVSLTGTNVYIQGTQGSPIFNAGDPLEWRNPAGNRFSLLHANPEEDWGVQNTSTFAEYFHHTPTFGNRTRPDHHDLDWLLPLDQSVPWPENRALACPSRLSRGRIERREQAEMEHEEEGESKNAYDAAKDDGDTYTLLGYVSDPGHSSAQVRNALQSVAPKVSIEVWRAAFERTPAMNAWHIAQALIGNSPLQGEVLKMTEEYGLPTAYAGLVYDAQNGEANILSLLRSEVALHAGLKGEALADLGRMTWLDTVVFDPWLDSLLQIHQELPAENSPMAKSGIYAAKGEYGLLEELADAEALAGECPELYSLLKNYVLAELGTGWDDAATVDIAYLTQLGEQRDVIGSAQANAWLHAFGQELPPEIIILPDNEQRSMVATKENHVVEWETGSSLEAFPNPTTGPLHVLYEVPDGSASAELHLLDIHGRVLFNTWLGSGPGLQQWNTGGLAAGLYIAELLLDGYAIQQTKVVVRR